MTGVDWGFDDLSAALDRQRRLFEQAPSFLAILRGPDHIFEFANDAYVRLLGHREYQGRPVREVLPEAEPQGFLKILDSVFRTGRTYRGRSQRFTLVDPESGVERNLLLSFQYRATRDLDGRITGIYAEGSNLTERAEDEAALERMRQQIHRRWAELESVYENAPVGLALLGAERLEYRRLNKVQAAIIGLSPEEVVGKSVREISPDLADAAEALFRRVVRGEIIRDVELEGELPQRPGELRSWLVSYAPIRQANGTVDAIICTALETTDLKRTEKALLQSEKLAAVGRLAGSIAHEINNPLEAVTNLLYLARRSEALQEAQEYIEGAERELRRVAAITTQTLRFYKQSSERQTVTSQELFSSTLGLFEHRLPGMQIALNKSRCVEQPVTCFEGEIRQVLNNLVGNAIDAMTPTGGRLLLRSRTGTEWRSERQGLWLTVADTGAGISPTLHARIFEPFVTTKGASGTGLGLWITKEILRRHAGHLTLRSRQHPERSGTVISIFLPFETALPA